jgi:hypothetical protein
MQLTKSMQLDRRKLLKLATAMAAGAFLTQGRRLWHFSTPNLHAAEMDMMNRSMPLRSRRIESIAEGNEIKFVRRDDERPLFITNPIGKWIWDACDGKTSPKTISSKILEAYDAPMNRVHGDCLIFLCRLRKKGLVHV